MVVQFIVFLNSANLICGGKDISKCFRESLGLQDNESRLYALYLVQITTVVHVLSFGSQCEKMYLLTYAPKTQIRSILVIRIKKLCILGYLKCAQLTFCSDHVCTD